MAKTQDLRRRIRSISNTRQLTKAMKMVSAAKLRRAQDRILSARPYAELTLKMLRSVAARCEHELNPLLMDHGDQNVEIVVVTADKGLAGPFNAGIIRVAEDFAATRSDKNIIFSAIGKKARDHFTRRGHAVERRWVDVFRDVRLSIADEVGEALVERYRAKDVDRVYLVYNEFKSAIQSKPVIQQLLPVEPQEFEVGELSDDYIYEPQPAKLLATLLPHYVQHLIFRALLESAAAEHAARMTAMDNATNNAGELIEALTLTMNRVRQASITTEIIEVVSGAEALS